MAFIQSLIKLATNIWSGSIIRFVRYALFLVRRIKRRDREHSFATMNRLIDTINYSWNPFKVYLFVYPCKQIEQFSFFFFSFFISFSRQNCLIWSTFIASSDFEGSRSVGISARVNVSQTNSQANCVTRCSRGKNLVSLVESK